MSNLVSLEEAVSFTGVSKSTIHKWLQRNEGSFDKEKRGRKIYLDSVKLLNFMYEKHKFPLKSRKKS